MLSFTFTVGSADDARIAADLCDFMAEQMAGTAAPRRGRSKKELTNDRPPPVAGRDTPAVLSVSDPVGLYAMLQGGEKPSPAVDEQPKVEPEAATTPKVEPEAAAVLELSGTREERFKKTVDAVKVLGAKWLGDYFKINASMGGKKMSDFSDDELAACYKAATAAAPKP